MELWTAALFLSTLVILGMPHGAIDHYLYFHLLRKKMAQLSLLAFVIVYLLISFFMAGLWILFPAVCVCALIGLTWYHWGEGEVIYERDQNCPVHWTFGAWRGALPMLIPVIGYAVDYQTVLTAGVHVVQPEADLGLIAFIDTPALRWVTIGCLFLLGATSWGLMMRSQALNIQTLRRRLLEDVALVLLFLMLPPLASIGIYFSLWHARRHIRVACRKFGKRTWDQGSVRWLTFYKMAAPFSIAGILLMSLLPIFFHSLRSDVAILIGSYLITLWSFTWPHAIICRMLHKNL